MSKKIPCQGDQFSLQTAGLEINGAEDAMKFDNRDDLKSIMRISTVEGSFAQVYTALAYIGSVFISKFAIMLGATPFQFGLLMAAAQFSQAFQIFGVVVSRRLHHHKMPSVLLALVARFLPILLVIPLLFMDRGWAIWVFLTIMFLSCSFASMSGNIWIAWVSDLFPRRVRGRFFSTRSQVHLMVGMVVGFLSSLFVDAFVTPREGWKFGLMQKLGVSGFFTAQNERYGITMVIVAGALISLVGLIYLYRQPDRGKEPDHRKLRVILVEPLKNANFRRLLYFTTWWMLALGIGSAFWQPFMLEKLRMSTFEITVYGTISSISMMLFIRGWGRFIDRYGNKTAMKIAIVLGSINPAVWCFVTPDSYWLLWIEAASSGFMWSGVGIIYTNFVLSIAPTEQRQTYSAIYWSVAGLCMMVSTILSGSFFPPALKIGFISLQPEQVLFAITALLRLTAEIPLQWVQEPRSVPLKRTLSILFSSRFMQMRSMMNKFFRIRT